MCCILENSRFKVLLLFPLQLSRLKRVYHEKCSSTRVGEWRFEMSRFLTCKHLPSSTVTRTSWESFTLPVSPYIQPFFFCPSLAQLTADVQGFLVHLGNIIQIGQQGEAAVVSRGARRAMGTLSTGKGRNGLKAPEPSHL